MSNLTPQQIELSTHWASLHEGAGQALQWIADTRGNAPRLDSEADSLNLRLHRARNLARNLGRVAGTPMTVGFFGLSQAGKSYLISALAAASNGQLETRFGEQKLDFIEHINPVGGGKEATGLVTRFTRNAKPSEDPIYPIELKLFSEIEIVKILANTWFKDFDLEHIAYEIDEPRIQRILKPFENIHGGTARPGLDADDVVSLWDYLEDMAPNSVKHLKHSYWPRVLKLAPLLGVLERAQLFSILWGEQRELSRAYEKLAQALHKLGRPSTVYAPLHALIKSNGSGGYSQADSIMNVDILDRFNLPDSIDVRPLVDGRLRNSESIGLAHLAALTTEMTFRLIDAPSNPVVTHLDLLDFPGYRGRLKLREVADSNQTAASASNSVSQLILRGKVAYLFERYTDCQEMNALAVCTSSVKQSDVDDVGPVLTRWISKTQGTTAQERGSRATGLIWALTMLDMRIDGALNLSAAQLEESWNNMIRLTMLERFGKFPWMDDWAGKPFNNTYLVRKPRMLAKFMDQAANKGPETAVNAEMRGQIDSLGAAFCANALVQRHVDNPRAAWDGLLVPNDGGIQRFGSSFVGVADIGFKLQRSNEQLLACRQELLHGLDSWYAADGDGAMAEKRIKAQAMLQALGKRLGSLGELISHLQLPSDNVRDLYLSGVYEQELVPHDETPEQPPAAASLYGDSSSFDFSDSFSDAFDDAPPPAATATKGPELEGNEHRFAKAVLKAWISHLRELPNRQNLLNLLGLPKPVVEAVVDEIISAGYRLGLAERLSAVVLKRAQSGSRRDQLVERQMLEVQLVLRDFVSWFGFIQTPLAERPKSRVGSRDHLFNFYSDVPAGQLPQLPPQASNLAQIFLGDWLSGLGEVTLGNAGHSAGREITADQNERLGRVLKHFQAN
jgi:hypothetical protein